MLKKKGLDYANYISNLVSSFLNLSIHLNSAMTKSNVIDLCRLIELLKSIQKAYYEKKEFLTLSKQYILQLTQRIVLSFIQNAKKRIVSDKKYSEKRLDILSGLVLAGNSLNGPPTKERLLVASYGISIANRLKTFKSEENIEDMMRKLEMFSFIETRIRQACDCSYLYWHFNFLSVNNEN